MHTIITPQYDELRLCYNLSHHQQLFKPEAHLKGTVLGKVSKIFLRNPSEKGPPTPRFFNVF